MGNDMGNRGPLRRERVLDASTGVAGAYCAKLLADLGAEVVKVESPAGDPLRRLGPFSKGHEGNPEASAPFLYFNSTKQSVVLDLDQEDGRERLLALVSRFDVLVIDGPAGALVPRGLGVDVLHEANAALVVATVSPFGSDGPYAAYQATHLVLSALGGWAHACGLPDREPLQAGGSTSETVAGAYAAVGILGALGGRDRNGTGDHVDVSSWEAAITCSLNPNPLMWEYRGEVGGRNSSVNTGPSFLIECGTGGYVGVNVLTEPQWETLCLFIDRPDLLLDERFTDGFSRTKYADQIGRAVATAFAERDAEDVFHTAQEWRLPFGPVVSPQRALDLLAHREREYFVEQDHPVVGRVRTPRIPFILPRARSLPSRAPLLGEHTESVLQEIDEPDGPRVAVRHRVAPAANGATGGPQAPLAGLRIVDFTMFQAGTMATMMAADLGADVIKIEAIQRIDGWRGVGRSGSRPWETSGLFNWVNRGKRGITLNLTDPRGSDIARALVASAGAVVENYTPRVMGNFGLDYAQLSAITPDLVMLSMPGFGLEGTWRDYAAFAWTTEELSTICHLTGYEGGPPMFTGTTFGDPLAGLMGAIALLSALRHRQLEGEGQHIDLSQVESCTSFVADAIIAAQLTGTEPTRRGNRNDSMAPHGTYPCADDRWIAIACRTDEEWRSLVSLVDLPALDPWLALSERISGLTELDRVIGTWTEKQDAFELMHRLQADGIPAGVVMCGIDMLADRHLNARGFFYEQERDEIGVKRHPRAPFRYATTEFNDDGPAPYLGQHNHEVLGGLLGLDEKEIAELERDKIIGNAPLT
ncbi:MAG: CaiB/BaiF CoA transferase family protein [Acidimicrobiia bacterium]